MGARRQGGDGAVAGTAVATLPVRSHAVRTGGAPVAGR